MRLDETPISGYSIRVVRAVRPNKLLIARYTFEYHFLNKLVGFAVPRQLKWLREGCIYEFGVKSVFEDDRAACSPPLLELEITVREAIARLVGTKLKSNGSVPRHFVVGRCSFQLKYGAEKLLRWDDGVQKVAQFVCGEASRGVHDGSEAK